VTVVDEVSISIRAGEIVGLVGETGCGKSMTALAILGLLPGGATAAGSISLEGRDLIGLSDRELRRFRGARMGYVAQDPTAALNPVLTIGNQLREILLAHAVTSRREVREREAELLKSVGIAEPTARLRAYPHQLSGGMRQRVAIAIAMACHPALLIADEPTTALDATVQRQIIELLVDSARAQRASVLLISHDLRLIAAVASRVYVMYAGRIVETGSAAEVMNAPTHPYTQALLRSTPRLRAVHTGRLPAIRGRPPDPHALPPGCRFHPRCVARQPICAEREPLLGAVSARAACWFPLVPSRAENDTQPPPRAPLGRLDDTPAEVDDR
jgi:oligopeptide/dipeptide ABC transporter ATP-binding protein